VENEMNAFLSFILSSSDEGIKERIKSKAQRIKERIKERIKSKAHDRGLCG
jgi:hypothetical protein